METDKYFQFSPISIILRVSTITKFFVVLTPIIPVDDDKENCDQLEVEIVETNSKKGASTNKVFTMAASRNLSFLTQFWTFV